MTVFWIGFGLFAYWLLIIWRARVEKGWVGVINLVELLRSHTIDLIDLNRKMRALTTAAQKATRSMSKYAEFWQRFELANSE